MVTCKATGLVYSNPKPYLKSRQAFHPTLVRLEDGELLCSYDLGEGVESLDYRTYLSRSSDCGETWVQQGSLVNDAATPPTSSSVRLTRLANGHLIGFGIRFHREDPEEGIVSRDTLGFVPLDLFTITSQDRGRTWTEPVTFTPPIQNPAFEICHSIVELPNGTWVLPTATAKGWDGSIPAGQRSVVFISKDQGATWSSSANTFHQPETIFWEQSLIRMDDGRLIVAAWAHDLVTGQNQPTPFAISNDSGTTFSEPYATGFEGQTCKLLSLGENRILCVYRRSDKPGLWATLSQIDGHTWKNLYDLPLWGSNLQSSGMVGEDNTFDELSGLHFGYPTLLRTGPTSVLVSFWCLEGWTCNIRWFKLEITS